MSNFFIVVDDAAKDAVITATTEAMPASNLKNNRRAFPYRSADLDPVTITLVYTARPVRAVGLSHHNLSADAVVTVDFLLATEIVASFTIAAVARDTWVGWSELEVDSDSCEIHIDDGDNPAGYLQIVQAKVGPMVTVEYNFALGATSDVAEDIEHRYSAAGSLSSSGTGQKRRENTINLSKVIPADRVVLHKALLKHGQGQDLLLSLYPGWGDELEWDHQYVAKRTSSLPTVQSGQDNFDIEIEFKEA